MSATGSPKVSVVMSAFNAEKYIHESIESILNQSFSDFEFLIFDDGSDDNTPKIIREYEKKDSRVKGFFREKNIGHEGMIANLNKGLEKAAGEYIARMDADDISYHERFAKQVKFLDDSPEIFLVGTGAINVDSKGKKLSVFRPITDSKKLAGKLPKVPSIYNPTTMFRKTNLRYIPLKGVEDYEFFLQLLKRGHKLSNMEENLLEYRVLTQSLSHSDPYLRAVNTVIAQEIYFGRLDREKLSKEIIDGYHPQKCSQEVLKRMVETAYLSRSYDVIFDIANINTKRFGADPQMMVWELISGLKMVVNKVVQMGAQLLD